MSIRGTLIKRPESAVPAEREKTSPRSPAGPTAKSATGVTAPRSRRALLAGLAGGMAALAAGAFRGLPTARAGVDGDVVLGAGNNETTTTTIINNGAEDALLVSALSGAGLFAQNHSSANPAVVGFGLGGGAGVQGTVGGGFTAGPGNVGVVGTTAAASDPTFIGVLGAGGDGTGVKGTSSTGLGVLGSGGTGVLGQSLGDNTGVQGFSGGSLATPPAGDADTGVLGTASADFGTGVRGSGAQTQTSNSVGVLGDGDTGVLGIGTFGALGSAAAAGIGVYGSVSDAPGVPDVFGGAGVTGQSDTKTGVLGFTGLTALAPPNYCGVYGVAQAGGTVGRGVYGYAPTGVGLQGQTTSGTGVRALATSTNGIALKVQGKASFDRSGKIVVSAGHSSVAKTAIPLTTSSFVIATLQTNVAGLFIQAVVTNPSGSSFTIYLNKAPTINVAVAWLVVN